MKVHVGLEITVEVEIDDKFKPLDVPYTKYGTVEIPEWLFEECALSAKKEVERTYPYYKDLNIYGVYSEAGNAMIEL